jgi:cation diffusion facilitator CzcD-associated flavoprotein CzcO
VAERLQAVVIGAGQAGLSAAYHLRRRGLEPWRDFIVLDGNDGPGGAWRHRWPSLTLGAAHGIHDLPGLPLGDPDPTEPSSGVVRRYYGTYERRFELPVIRPAAVASVSTDDAGSPTTPGSPTAVAADGPATDDAGSPTTAGSPTPGATDDAGFLVAATDGRAWHGTAVINATGTWTKPHWPSYPGQRGFRGRQLHTRDFWSVDEFAGRRVLVVGGGASAVQFLLQLSAAGVDTLWSTRREPEFTDAAADPNWGVAVERRVAERTRAGLPPLSVAAATGLLLGPEYRKGIEDGVLVSRGPIRRFAATPGESADGLVEFADGTAERIDVVLWATGFRAALDHLAPLRLREPGGGITMAADGVTVVRRPGLFLVGYGASASTIGATRAGRASARAAYDYIATRPAAPVPVG